MDERRCDSMVEAIDCLGGVAVSICSLEAVAPETQSFISRSPTQTTFIVDLNYLQCIQEGFDCDRRHSSEIPTD